MDPVRWVILRALQLRLTSSAISQYEAALGCLALERLFPESTNNFLGNTSSDEMWVHHVHRRLHDIWKHNVDYPEEHRELLGSVADTVWDGHSLSEKIAVNGEVERLLKQLEETDGLHKNGDTGSATRRIGKGPQNSTT